MDRTPDSLARTAPLSERLMALRLALPDLIVPDAQARLLATVSPAVQNVGAIAACDDLDQVRLVQQTCAELGLSYRFPEHASRGPCDVLIDLFRVCCSLPVAC